MMIHVYHGYQIRANSLSAIVGTHVSYTVRFSKQHQVSFKESDVILHLRLVYVVEL